MLRLNQQSSNRGSLPDYLQVNVNREFIVLNREWDQIVLVVSKVMLQLPFANDVALSSLKIRLVAFTSVTRTNRHLDCCGIVGSSILQEFVRNLHPRYLVTKYASHVNLMGWFNLNLEAVVGRRIASHLYLRLAEAFTNPSMGSITSTSVKWVIVSVDLNP